MIVSFMKIVPCEQYAECLLAGNLYCNTVRYFREEGYDEHEGAAFVHPDTLRIGSYSIPQGRFGRSGDHKPNRVADLNVFCMFSWRVTQDGRRQDPD